MHGTGVIDHFLEVFTSYIDSGFGLLGGEVAFLSSILIGIDLTLAGLFWAWGADTDVLARLVKKTLYVGFFALIIGNFNGLSKIVFDSFSGLGLLASGSTMTPAELLQPGHVAQVGLDAGKPILDAAGQLMGFVSFFENFIQIAILLLAWLVVLIAFFLLAVQLFVTLIEFKLTTLAGFILIPFALFNKTAFLAERVLGNVVASGVKILVLAVIIGIGTTLFGQFTAGFAGNQPSLEDAMTIMLAALALLGLGIFGTGIATGLVSGAPQLGAGAAVGTALAVGGLGVAGALGARAAAGAVGGAARGGAALAGGAATAYRLGAATSGETGLRAAAAGAAGVAKAGGGLALLPFRQAGAALQSQMSAGGRAAFALTGGKGAVAATESAAASSPAWAERLRQSQAMSHGVTAAAHAVRSADHGGGGASVNLSEER
jgi:type IV secretion system protein TrbL